MIPDNELSSISHFSGYSFPVKQYGDLLIDWELGGIGLNDASQGLMVQVWELRCAFNQANDLWEFKLSAPAHPASVVFTWPDEVEECAISFDQNMNPFIAFVSEGDAYIWWYDSTTEDMEVSALPAGVRNPRASIDDHRSFNVADSDNILSYVRDGYLCVRYQRERYATEYQLRFVGEDAELVSSAMNAANSFQWRLRQYAGAIGNDVTVAADPYLSDVVLDLLMRSGVDRKDIDTSKLLNPVKGYKVATQAGADVLVQPLRQGWFFDSSEYDKKLRFIPRGGEVSAIIRPDDMLEEDGAPLNMERVQEAELLRKVSLVYVDPASGYTPMTQAAERRSNTVNATSESMTELPVTMSSDEAATVASRRLKVAWAELHKANFRLGVPWSSLTPADVVEVNDHRGNRYRMRVVSITEDAGQFDVECIEDADYAYRSTATGVVPAPPRSTAPGIAGKTEAYPMNLPALRTSDNVPGIYVAAIGTGRGWVGCEFWISADDGQTYSPAGSTDVSSFVGELVDAIGPTDSTFEVEMYTGELHNATPEQLAARQNAFAILTSGVAEIGQFETATEGDPKVYELDEVVRGLLDTTAASHGSGDTFVLLDEAVTFVPVDAAFAGRTLLLKAVSFGASLDQADAVPFLYQPIVRPTQFYRRDDLAAVGGEDTITMDKAPTGLQILRDGVLMTSGYTLSGLVATLSAPATAGEEYTVIYWASEEPAATTLT